MEDKIKEFITKYCEVRIGHPTADGLADENCVYMDVGIKSKFFDPTEKDAIDSEFRYDNVESIFCFLFDVELIEGYRIPSEVKMMFAIERNKFIEKLVK